jgi:hypothetical protein
MYSLLLEKFFVITFFLVYNVFVLSLSTRSILIHMDCLFLIIGETVSYSMEIEQEFSRYNNMNLGWKL